MSRVAMADSGVAPIVAVLCTPPRARAAAAAVALGLARATRHPCALATAVGGGPGVAFGALPSARRAVAALRERDLSVAAGARLVWLADRRGPASTDVVARAAASSAELARSVAATGAPAAVALPFARTVALDRVLAWHDALVIVREPDAPDAIVQRARESVAALGRPVAVLDPPPRLPAALAVAGIAAPAELARVVAELGIARPALHDA